jgi:hypothetical protein
MAVTQKRRRTRSKNDGAGWRRSPITAVVALIIIALCLYNMFSSGGNASSLYKGDYVCRECRETFRLPFMRGESPFVCPSCSKSALYSSLYCKACDKVTASLPPVRDFTCTACGHHENARLKPENGPFDCPKCSKKSFSETYECLSCKNVFGWQRPAPTLAPENGENGEPLGMYEEFAMATCPKCSKKEGYPYIENPLTTCEFCNSEELNSVTPISVVKWELGRELKPSEEKEVEAWRKAHP